MGRTGLAASWRASLVSQNFWEFLDAYLALYTLPRNSCPPGKPSTSLLSGLTQTFFCLPFLSLFPHPYHIFFIFYQHPYNFVSISASICPSYHLDLGCLLFLRSLCLYFYLPLLDSFIVLRFLVSFHFSVSGLASSPAAAKL